MVRTVNFSLSEEDFRRVKKAKAETGETWEEFVLGRADEVLGNE